jgi:hypothetical protein
LILDVLESESDNEFSELNNSISYDFVMNVTSDESFFVFHGGEDTNQLPLGSDAV